MNPQIRCLHCGVAQSWENSLWSMGPDSMKASFTCPGCGWLVGASSYTIQFMIQQMDAQSRSWLAGWLVGPIAQDAIRDKTEDVGCVLSALADAIMEPADD